MRFSIIGILIIVLASSSCVSTGDNDHPIHFYGWRVYVFGHEKYTPQQAAYERCVYRNRLPDGSRSGFSRLCRLRPAQLGIPTGINSAMYATGCVMNLCHKAVSDLPDFLPGDDQPGWTP